MHQLKPEEITKSGFKYWLDSKGQLFQTEEHSVGAKRWAMQNLDDPPMTFGVKNLNDLGWVRIVTEKNNIWLTGNIGPSGVTLTPAQTKGVKSLEDRFFELNGVKPKVDRGGVSPSIPSAPPENLAKADKALVQPSYRDRKGVALFGDSLIQRFVSLFS
jgi:hypothetical protein